jgi:hypothetical protein
LEGRRAKKSTKMPRWSVKDQQDGASGGHAMKIILSAGAIVALLAGPCFAQVNMGQGKTGEWNDRIAEGERIERQAKEKELDNAVKAAGKKIPEPKVKYDPWKNAR